MELTMTRGFNEMSQNEMMEVDGGGLGAAIAMGLFSVGAGIAVLALTPAKKTGVKIIAGGLTAAVCLYYV